MDAIENKNTEKPIQLKVIGQKTHNFKSLARLTKKKDCRYQIAT